MVFYLLSSKRNPYVLYLDKKVKYDLIHMLDIRQVLKGLKNKLEEGAPSESLHRC